MCSLDTIFTEDIFYEICSYLSLEEELKINHELRQSLEPHVRKIQLWYRKYKEKRYIRYTTLYNEFQKRNPKMLECYYGNVFFSLYNIKKLRKSLNEYHFYCILDYYYRDYSQELESILCLYHKTLVKPTYTNLKFFLKKLPIKVILRC